ncbi:MAG: HIT family protein [Candidatus Aenigmatarchaeota archaeon]|nr:MAG: HIT family protein [Candidatus Aenigmarchaeota archaeon]
MDGCVFCKIATKEIASEIIYEDDKTLAFLDINPITPGHTVVIPKGHASSIVDMDTKGVQAVFTAVRNVVQQIQKAMSPVGFNYGVNQGRAAGQAIDHLHVHVLPRFENDGGGSIHMIVRNPPRKQTVEEIGGTIRAASGFVQKDEPAEEAPAKKEEPKEDLEKKMKALEEEMSKHIATLKRMRRP